MPDEEKPKIRKTIKKKDPMPQEKPEPKPEDFNIPRVHGVPYGGRVEETKMTSVDEARRRREEFEKNLQSDNPWNRSPLGLEAERASLSMMNTRHGLYARVPIFCKGRKCPYAQSCDLLEANLAPVGERCPVESSRIAQEYYGYADQFDIENATMTDKILMSEIISMDILAGRATALMAKEQTPVQDMIIGLSESGEPIMQPAVSKAFEAYDKISRRRNELLQLMNATRKDQSKIPKEETPVESIQEILVQAVSDPDFDKVDERPSDIEETDRGNLK